MWELFCATYNWRNEAASAGYLAWHAAVLVVQLIKPKIPLVASRHDMIRTTCFASRDVTCRPCVLHRACSNMVDDEEALVIG